MIKFGEVQTLEVVKTTDFGVYLGESKESETRILLPKNTTPAGAKMGDSIEVFLYKDSSDRPIATTTIPPLVIGGIALLQVKEVTAIGAFLEWGLAKDLLLPFKEQTARVHAGDDVLVTLYIDKSERLCASMKVYDYLELDSPYKKDDKVIGLVYEIIEAYGAFVAVDNKYCGLIPNTELHRTLKVGDSVEARVIKVKEDGKLDLSIREKVHVQMDEDSELIYNKLLEADGFLPYHDKTDKEVLKAEFNLSKNAFKRAVGRLLKEDKITLSDKGITKK